MSKRGMVAIACLLLLGGIPAPAFENLEGTYEEPPQMARALDPSDNSSINLMIASHTNESERGSERTDETIGSGSYGQICMGCGCDTEHTNRLRSESCCKPDCARQHPGTCENNYCIWSFEERLWRHNQCATILPRPVRAYESISYAAGSGVYIVRGRSRGIWGC